MFCHRIVLAIRRVVVSSLAALALVGSTLGCYSHRPHTTPTTGQSGRLKLAQNAPVAIVRGKGGSDTVLLRSISALEGTLLRVTPDTLAVRVERTTPFARQAANQIALIPRDAATDFSARKLDEGRTMVAALGIAFMIFFLVYAVSWDLGFGETTSTGY